MIVLALPSSQHFRTHDLTDELDSDVAEKRTNGKYVTGAMCHVGQMQSLVISLVV
jgi:hypothetical protein